MQFLYQKNIIMHPPHQNNNFDFLRFYFAFIVVVGHTIVLSNAEQLQLLRPYFNTYISVTGFFCISGFLIARSFLNSGSLKDYLKKRAARLLPAYVLVILLCVFFLSFFSTYSFREYFFHPQLYKYLAANLTFANFIQPCLPGVFLEEGMGCAVNGALWTIKVEVAFYLFIPILLFFAGKIKRKYILFIAVYLLSVLYKEGLSYLYDVSGNEFYAVFARQLPGFLSYFICGVALHYYHSVFIKHKYKLFVLGLVLFFFADKIFHIELFTPVGLALMIFTFAFSLKQLNSFGKFGDFSYGIYIFHCPIINTVTYLGFFNTYNPFIVAGIVILIVLLVGFLSWNLVEKHFLALAKSSRIVQPAK